MTVLRRFHGVLNDGTTALIAEKYIGHKCVVEVREEKYGIRKIQTLAIYVADPTEKDKYHQITTSEIIGVEGKDRYVTKHNIYSFDVKEELLIH